MGIVVPAGYISTPDAFTERLNANAKWRRLSESWRKDGRPINGTYAAIEKRQKAAARVLYSALTRGEITLYAYTVDDIGKPLLEVLTGAYRSDPAAETELRLGSIHKSRKPPHGATLCFLRDDWRTWLGIEPLAAETPPPSATEHPTEPKAEQPKVVRRTAGAKLTKREAVKDYLQKTYPGGVPAGVKNESIASLHGVHEKTVRRALKEMGQNTDR